MKPHHAAALALVGWYLMMPPLKENPLVRSPTYEPSRSNEGDLVDTKAPLSIWTNVRSFDSASQCNWMLDHLTKDYDKDIDRELHKEVGRDPKEADRDISSDKFLRHYVGSLRIERAKCIATDDPRLKGN
jgi:hypothetical protein